MANCVVIDGYLYGITGNTHGAEKKELVCMDFETGKVKWKEGGFGCGTITAANGCPPIIVDSIVIVDPPPLAVDPTVLLDGQ